MSAYTLGEFKKRLPLIRFYSKTIEELCSKLSIINNRIIDIDSKKFETQEKTFKALKISSELHYRFELIESRLFDIVEELKDMNISICIPAFGSLDIPIFYNNKIIYICYDHIVHDSDEFMCHKLVNGIKKTNKHLKLSEC